MSENAWARAAEIDASLAEYAAFRRKIVDQIASSPYWLPNAICRFALLNCDAGTWCLKQARKLNSMVLRGQ